jgi:hypothetical protein
MYMDHCSGHQAAKLVQPPTSHSAFGYHQRRIIRDELRQAASTHLYLLGMLSKLLEVIVGWKSLEMMQLSSSSARRKSGG